MNAYRNPRRPPTASLPLVGESVVARYFMDNVMMTSGLSNFSSHRYAQHKMWPIATVVAVCVCLSVGHDDELPANDCYVLLQTIYARCRWWPSVRPTLHKLVSSYCCTVAPCLLRLSTHQQHVLLHTRPLYIIRPHST